MNKYPYWRVGIVFAFCPAIIGLYVALGMLYKSIGNPAFANMKVPIALFAPYLMFVCMVFAIFIEIIPSTALSVLYLILKLQRGWRSYVFVGFAGGIVSSLWNFFLPLDIMIWHFVEDRKISELLSYLVSGAISSVVAAFLILPKRTTSKRSKKAACSTTAV